MNKMNFLSTVLIVLAFSSTLSAETLVLGAPEGPIAGMVQIAAGTVVTGIEAYVAEGDTLTLAGGDISITSAGEGMLPSIKTVGGKLTVACNVSAPNGLKFEGGSEMLVQEDFYPQAWNHSPTATLFAADKNIDDYIPWIGKRSSSYNEKINPTPGYPHVVKRSPGELTFEMQYINDYLRSIKVRLFQQDNDIYAQVMWARYGHRDLGYGSSLENEGSYISGVSVDSKSNPVTEGSSSIWFGVHTLVLVRDFNPEKLNQEFFGELKISNRIEINSSHISIEGNADLGETLSIPISFSNAVLRVKRNTDTVISSDMSSSSYSVLSLGGGELVRGKIDWITTAETNLFKGVALEDIEITYAYSAQGKIEKYTKFDSDHWFGHCKRTETNLTFQAQGYSDTWNKCAIVEIRQKDMTNITAKVVKRPYQKIDQSPLGTDMSIPENTTGASGAYLAVDVSYTVAPKISLAGTLMNENDFRVNVESGAVVYVDSTIALPHQEKGSVTIEKGGKVSWMAGRTESGAHPRFFVEGKLYYYSPGYGVETPRYGNTIDGGIVKYLSFGEGTSSHESQMYVNRVILRNGARLQGRRPRLGYNTRCEWVVEGNSPSYWENGGYLVGGGNETTEYRYYDLVLNVKDVTGDEEADLISTPAVFSGFEDTLFTDYNNPNLKRLLLVKTGAGTWEWRAKGGSWTGRLVIEEGTVRFTKSESLDPAGLGVYLDGGELQLGDASTNTIPKLEIASNSSLCLGEEAVIEFPDTTIAFASGTSISNEVMRIDISGPHISDGKRTGVRFGTTKCLPDEWIAKIRYNDYIVTQDTDGWILTGRRGTVLILR